MHHSSGAYGENLYGAWGQPVHTSPAAVNAWYSEVKFYNFGRPGFGMKTGHFTQVVWKGSRQMGCGYSKNYVCCRYLPAGNFMGRFPQNVLRR